MLLATQPGEHAAYGTHLRLTEWLSRSMQTCIRTMSCLESYPLKLPFVGKFEYLSNASALLRPVWLAHDTLERLRGHTSGKIIHDDHHMDFLIGNWDAIVDPLAQFFRRGRARFFQNDGGQRHLAPPFVRDTEVGSLPHCRVLDGERLDYLLEPMFGLHISTIPNFGLSTQ